MKQKTFFAQATLAVALAIFSSTAAMGQEKKESQDIDWMKELKDRAGVTDEGDIKKMNRILDMLDEDDDVQAVYHNWNMPEEEEED